MIIESRWFSKPSSPKARSRASVKLSCVAMEVENNDQDLINSSYGKMTTGSINFDNEPIELEDDFFDKEKHVPTIFWNDKPPIEFGTALSDDQLNAECDLKYQDFQFIYDPPEGTVLKVGTHTLSADLCYFRDGEMCFVSKSVQIVVQPRRPSIPINIDTPSPSNISKIAGRIFNWSPKSKTSPIGNVNSYNSSGITIKWNDPESIQFGKLLSKTQLNAITVPFTTGQYRYTPDFGEKLPIGKHQLKVEFRPSNIDRQFLQPITKIVHIEVYSRTRKVSDTPVVITSEGNEGENENIQEKQSPKKGFLNYCRKDFSRHLKINSSTYSSVSPSKTLPGR